MLHKKLIKTCSENIVSVRQGEFLGINIDIKTFLNYPVKFYAKLPVENFIDKLVFHLTLA